VDLPALVNQLAGRAAGHAVQRWLADLSALDPGRQDEGRSVTRNIDGEENLPVTSDGHDALLRFAERLMLRTPSDDALTWYEQLLQDPASHLVLCGPEADATLPDRLCRLVDAWTVLNFLARDDRPGDPADIEDWLRSVCSADYLEFLDEAKIVSAKVPSLFSTFEEDRDATFPVGTAAGDCLQVLGKQPPSTPIAHALLKFQRGGLEPPRLPTAFDASTHPNFLSPPAGAACGMTRNLLTTGASGVREVVVRPFPVARLNDLEYIAP